MKKVIKLSITIDNNSKMGINSTFTVSDMLFTDFDHLLSYDQIKENVVTALKQSKGFTTLTIDVYSHEENNYQYGNQNVIMGIRFLCSSGDITKANLINNCYQNWDTSSKNEIFYDIKLAVDKVNSKYIEFIKEATTV